MGFMNDYVNGEAPGRVGAPPDANEAALRPSIAPDNYKGNTGRAF